WAKAPGELAYSEVARYTAPLASGSFSFAALAGDGSYSFYTVSADEAGNVEAAPASADATTLLDTVAPTSAASSAHYSTSTTISVAYTASDPGYSASGLDKVELWVKTPGASEYAKAMTAATPSASGSFSYAATAGDGSYSFYTVSADEAGNVEAAPASAD